MAYSLILQPALAGLSMGAFCFSYCFPFLATFIASEDRRHRRNLFLIFCFLIGRFLGYMVFGLVLGLIGAAIQSIVIHVLTDLALILISIVLLLHLRGLKKGWPHGACAVPHWQHRNALVMGFLMGITICPPFLLSITYVLSLHSVVDSLIYFLIFFVTSSLYFLPMIFIGMLAKMREFQTMARTSGIICGWLFMAYGLYSMIRHLGWGP